MKDRYIKLDIQGNLLPGSAKAWSMVKDNVTGLVWEVKTNDGSIHGKNNKYNWLDAQDIFIAKVNAEKFCGFSDWRLPAIEELQLLVDYTKYNPAIDKTAFPNTMSSGYWSSTTDACDTYYVWRVGFYYGGVGSGHKSDTYYVRAVRSGQSR